MTRWRERLKLSIEWSLCVASVPVTGPLVAILAVAVAVTSRGGAFHRARRLGRDGRVFSCLKLRTMYPGAPMIVSADAKTVVEEDDPRVTPLGRVLRNGLDELPQLWNVLKGDMGLVGPRPDADWMLPRYTPTIRRRLRLRPGITGLAQVLDSRGVLTTAQGYAVDAWYTEHHSFVMDIWIVAATFVYLAGGKDIGQSRLRYLRRQGVLDAFGFEPLSASESCLGALAGAARPVA
jgi:lipopolysaccharide/colanic/teichoic acid biosynthesis glycosyltransferase